jgi:chromosome segregation ATPase
MYNEDNYQLKYFEILEKYTEALLESREHWENSQELKSSLETSLEALEQAFNQIGEAGKTLSGIASELTKNKDNPKIVEDLATGLCSFADIFKQQWQKDKQKMSYLPPTENAELTQFITHELGRRVMQN